MSSSRSICCDSFASSSQLKKPKTARDIILGWDRFNSTWLGLLLLSFAIWCGVYFAVYVPVDEEHGAEHAAMEHHSF